MEQGNDLRIPNREFGLVVGEPAEFRFFTSAVRKNDQPGDVVPVSFETASPRRACCKCT